MIQQNVTNRYTEIYVGGGNFVTQSYPTNYHQFWTRKMLGPDDNIDNYMEVTAAKRKLLEAADVAYVRPPDSFILEATAVGIAWNESTGYFALNGLTNLTYDDVLCILTLYPFAARTTVFPVGVVRASFACSKIRTMVPFDIGRQGGATNASNMFEDCINLEVVHLNPTKQLTPYSSGVVDASAMFLRCTKLHTVKGLVLANNANTNRMFNGCIRLETLELINLNSDLNLSSSPLLSAKTLTGIVAERYVKGKYPHETPIDANEVTITLHPTAYARLTEDMIADALDKHITFTTT